MPAGRQRQGGKQRMLGKNITALDELIDPVLAVSGLTAN
jgi:hypothetical protein